MVSENDGQANFFSGVIKSLKIILRPLKSHTTVHVLSFIIIQGLSTQQRRETLDIIVVSAVIREELLEICSRIWENKAFGLERKSNKTFKAAKTWLP